MRDIEQLENKIKYSFKDKELVENALTHSSYSRENSEYKRNNERLEFLGDAFLDAVIGEALYKAFSNKEEGFLSKTRASLVCEKSLAQIGGQLELGKYIMLGRGEEKNGGRHRDSIIADAVEAIIGAVYLDGGFDEMKNMVLFLFDGMIKDVLSGKYVIKDYKTELQEKLQENGSRSIKYVLVGETGPDHNKIFDVELIVDDVPRCRGRGKSKKQAEQNAAGIMLEKETL